MSHRTTSEPDRQAVEPTRPAEVGMEQVRAAVQAVRFGEVRVVIQDGVIVQIDRVEKQRLR
jgi:hypothetical protein